MANHAGRWYTTPYLEDLAMIEHLERIAVAVLSWDLACWCYVECPGNRPVGQRC